MNNIEKRMSEMMNIIDESIQLTDDRNDLLMLACAMMQRVREIFDSQIGEEGRRKMFEDLVQPCCGVLIQIFFKYQISLYIFNTSTTAG